jgi:4-amino-4-deoxy-L-arabinose transferase-like glycosyltransferase
MRDEAVPPPTARSILLTLALMFAVAWFAQLGIRHLIPSDEGRYAEMAREMLASGDWITPRYNGYKYFEKPPLQTWCNALTFAWFGLGEWQARLYTALTGFFGIVVVGLSAARVFGARAGTAAAAVLAASPYWNLLGHFNALDMGLSFWMTVTLCALLLAQRDGVPPARARLWMWLCWAAMGLAVLSKGLIGVVLPGAVLVLYTLALRDWALWRRLHLGTGLLVFALVVVPWFLLVDSRNPEFARFFFIYEHFDRFLKPDHKRTGPAWYFVPYILAAVAPWLATCVPAARRAWTLPRQANGFAPVALLAVWAAFIFVFFSISKSKLPSYVLPVIPALAMLLAPHVAAMRAAQWRVTLVFSALVLVALAAAGFLIRPEGSARTPVAQYQSYIHWAELAVGCALAGIVGAFWLCRRRSALTVLAYAAAWFALSSIAGNAHEVFGRASSGADLAPAIRAAFARQAGDAPFYAIGTLDHTVPFYARHVTTMVAVQDELAFGISIEPHKWLPSIDAWIARWNASAPAAAGLALMSPQTYEALRARSVPMEVVARDLRRVVVARPGA